MENVEHGMDRNGDCICGWTNPHPWNRNDLQGAAYMEHETGKPTPPTARELILIEALFRQSEYIGDGASREGIAQAISEDIAKIGGMPMVWDRLSVMPSAQQVFDAASKKAGELGL